MDCSVQSDSPWWSCWSRESPGLRLCWMICIRSLRLLLWGHQISVNLFLSAGDSCTYANTSVPLVACFIHANTIHLFREYLITMFLSHANFPCTDLFLSKITSRVHGSDKPELLPGNDQLNIIIISAAFLCQHQ